MRSIHDKRYRRIIAFIVGHREEAGITQVQLSKMLHLRQEIISKIENCDRRIDILELIDYCSHVGISISDVVALLDRNSITTQHLR